MLPADDVATPILCCGGGTPHKPPVMRRSGFVLHEGTELAEYLIAKVCSRLGQCPVTFVPAPFGLGLHCLPSGSAIAAVCSACRTRKQHHPRQTVLDDACAGCGAPAHPEGGIQLRHHWQRVFRCDHPRYSGRLGVGASLRGRRDLCIPNSGGSAKLVCDPGSGLPSRREAACLQFAPIPELHAGNWAL